MNFSSDFFEIFSIPQMWDIDLDGLSIRYRALQQEFHPDKFTTKSDVEKRVSVQTASLINQAFETLKSPLKRAQYLLVINGIDIDQETHITTDGTFLMQQIELREALAGVSGRVDPWSELDCLRKSIEQTYCDLQIDFNKQYSARAFEDALAVVAKMQFFDKLVREIEYLEDELEDL